MFRKQYLLVNLIFRSGPKYLPAGRPVQSELWLPLHSVPFLFAMDFPPFDLEPDLDFQKSEEPLSLLAEVVIRCPGHHVCRTAIRRQLFVTDIPIEFGKNTFSILQGKVLFGGRLPWITTTPGSEVIQHESVDVSNFNRIIEACSGIGGVSTGLKFCHAKAACFIDSNDKFAEWLDRKEIAPVIHGDISDHRVIKQVAEITEEKPLPLNGGVACQPFSALGDQRQQSDPRSNSLPALLRMGYFLRSPIITIECTKEAFESHWVQDMLVRFCQQTGYKLDQTILNLHCTWPSHRTRWWACLSMPMLGLDGIPNMPQMDFVPSVMHLLQIQSHLPPPECQQLNLTLFELRHFHDQPQGIASSIINAAKAMPTATHSWGSQLGPCHCGCRQYGFSLARLSKKGLYGVLIPLGPMVKSGSDWFHAMRHPHPKEVAILNALDPRYLNNSDPFTLKFLLAGVGQIASPLQGAWVYSNIFFKLKQNGFPISVDPPRHVIANLCKELLEARVATWPHFVPTRATVLFERELARIDRPLTTLHQDDVDTYVSDQIVAQNHVNDHADENQELNQGSVSEMNTTEMPAPFVHEHDRRIDDFELDMPQFAELLQALVPIQIEVPQVQIANLVDETSIMKDDVETPCMSPDFQVLIKPTEVTNTKTASDSVKDPADEISCTDQHGVVSTAVTPLHVLPLPFSTSGCTFDLMNRGGTGVGKESTSEQISPNRLSHPVHPAVPVHTGVASEAGHVSCVGSEVRHASPQSHKGHDSEAGVVCVSHSHQSAAARDEASPHITGIATETETEDHLKSSCKRVQSFPTSSGVGTEFCTSDQKLPLAGTSSQYQTLPPGEGCVSFPCAATDSHASEAGLPTQAGKASEAGTLLTCSRFSEDVNSLKAGSCTVEHGIASEAGNTVSPAFNAQSKPAGSSYHVNGPVITDRTTVEHGPTEPESHQSSKPCGYYPSQQKNHEPSKAFIPSARGATTDSKLALPNAGTTPKSSPIVGIGEISPGQVKKMHSTIFHHAKDAHECMTTKPDPLFHNDPWTSARRHQGQMDGTRSLANHIQPTKQHDQIYNSNGGINQFANAKRSFSQDVSRDSKRTCMHETFSTCDSFPTDGCSKQSERDLDKTTTAPCKQAWVGHTEGAMHQVKVMPGTTVGQLATAERCLTDMPEPVRTTDAMGALLPVYRQVQDQQIVLIEDGRLTHQIEYPATQGLSRTDLLWKQQGWVADDEMSFYLQMLGQPNLANTTSPLIMENCDSDAEAFGRWIDLGLDRFAASNQTYTMHTACLLNRHWFPITAKFHADGIKITTTLPEIAKVKSWASEALGNELVFHYKVPIEVFPADCGFQTIAWIMAQELSESQAYPMTAEDAIKWRTMFAQHVANLGTSGIVCPAIKFGGMQEPQQAELVNLLQQHGVKKERSTLLANQLVQTFGIVSMQQTLGAARPWSDLKTKASSHQPPIKLVLNEELQQQIAERLRSGQPMGSKKGKKARQPTASKWVAPQASQVQIPDGIFQQQDGTALKQISLHQLQLNQKGVAVVNIQDAAPFFNLQQPLCSEGVGMLVLEFSDSALPINHQIVRFPASCPETGEPMILTAALLQLGHQTVSRVLPSDPTAVDLVDTSVLRFALYKDQCTIPWQSLANKPVRALLELEHFADLDKGDLLDVWDRQHLGKQYQKMKPDESAIFSVVMRVRSTCVPKLMEFNSKDGLYIEPRTPNGREPCPEHRVIWLPRLAFHDTLIAKQATGHITHIARSGDRFGLRTPVQHAEAVHRQHRPEVAYLDGANTKSFKIAPLPFGSTKQSIQKVFEEWSWTARPSHTQGLTPDKAGLVWIAHATEPPPFQIFTMKHGDVLISELPSNKPHVAPKEGVPVASIKTLRHLSASASQPSSRNADHAKQDPLQINDPWAEAHKHHNSAKSQITPSQLASMEAKVEKRVMAQLQNCLPNQKGEDTPMDSSDSRVTQLESQVHTLTDNLNQLTNSMSAFKQQQHAHNTQVAQQVQVLKTQADQQEHTMKSLLDQKLEEQMCRIEALLTNKRTKTSTE